MRFAKAADGWAALAELPPGRGGGGDLRRGGGIKCKFDLVWPNVF